MISWIDLTNFAILSAGLMLAILGMMLSIYTRDMEKKSHQFFIVFFSTTFLYSFWNLINYISMIFSGSDYASLSRVSMFLYSWFSAALIPMLTGYMLLCCGSSIGKSWLFWINLLLLLLYTALLIYTQFSGQIYQISESNIYQRGPYYPMLLIPPAIQMLVNIIALFRRFHSLSRNQIKGFLYSFLFPLISLVIQMMLFGLLFVALGATLSALILFGLVLKEQREKNLHLAEENARQQIDIMLLQMRPHFICNTLSSIYYLCEMDPAKAQDVLGSFTTYLRKNFSAITKEGLIPFEEELEHTRAYLVVEKARYEKLLFVEYDIRYTMFRLPPLTLQPLVENAVKHGLDPERPALHLWIRTRKTNNAIEILVEDDGPGFENYQNDPEHIGLSNVQKRLQMLCQASMEILCRETGGTTVIIRIPVHAPQALNNQ